MINIMKVLMLNPSYSERKLSTDPILTRCTGVPSKAPYVWPPIGLAYIASALRKSSGAEVRVIDAQVEKFDTEIFRGFDLVALNAGTSTIDYDVRLAKKIENFGPRVAMIGVHAAYFHKEVIRHCDFVIRGEPDRVLADLVTCLDEEGDLSKVKGITWKDRGKIRVNGDDPPGDDLDSLPFQGEDLLSKGYYDIIAKRKPIAFMITSRGCPFGCRFCSAKFYSREYRFRSAENVFEEVKCLAGRGIKDITFFDDSFTINRERVMKLCSLMKEAKLDLSWRCLSRTDTVDREMLENMKDSGCYQIQFGVESGDQGMLDLMKKGVKVEKVKETFRLCDEAGIETVGFFMLGYPGETLDSIKNSMELAKSMRPDFVTFNLFTPLPGSEVFDSMPRKEWGKYDFTSSSFCDLPSPRMLEIIGKAYRGYYLKPSYVLRRVRKTKEPGRIMMQNASFWRKRGGVLWEFIRGKT